MNKIIFTNDIIFISRVGPGGLGVTRILFGMVASPTSFYPKLQITYYFHKEHHPLFEEIAAKLRITGAQKLFLNPQGNFVAEQPKTSEVLIDPTITRKAKQLTLLQRLEPNLAKKRNFNNMPNGYQPDSMEKGS